MATLAVGWCAFGESAAESIGMATTWPPRTVIRKSSGLRTLESALYRSGLGPVAGVDEVGRGACAGPLVVAACVLGPGRLDSLAALDDSKKLTEKARERLFPLIRRYAMAYHVVFIPSTEVDRRGVHVANIEGMRRAVAGLLVRPGYVLSDGFRVPGLAVPSLPVIGGDAAAACIAAASVLAKVSRDRLMVAMEDDHPGYGFAVHKGYSTPAHSAALNELGPCTEHRYSFINVRRVGCLPGDDAGRLRPGVGAPPARGGEFGYLALPGDDAGMRTVAECQPVDDADHYQPEVGTGHPAQPGQQYEDGWGKMEQVNRPWDGEGRLSR